MSANKTKRITNLQRAHDDVRNGNWKLFDASMFKPEVYLRDHNRHTLKMADERKRINSGHGNQDRVRQMNTGNE